MGVIPVLQQSFFDLLTTRNVDQAVEIFEENASFFFPGLREKKGKGAIRRMLGMILSRFSEIQWKTEPEIFAEPDLVVSRWTVHGLYCTGKRYYNEGVSILRIGPNGKIVYFKDFFVSTDFSDK